MIPDGWGCDGRGKVSELHHIQYTFTMFSSEFYDVFQQTNDPAAALGDGGGCLPLGGMEENGVQNF